MGHVKRNTKETGTTPTTDNDMALKETEIPATSDIKIPDQYIADHRE